MSKLSSQQEKFCRNVVEGMTNGQAYANAGYSCKDLNTASAAASRLLKDVRITDRITALKKDATESVEITVQWLQDQARTVLENALMDRSHAAAINAIKELGILSGERVEKRENKNINHDAEDFTEAELAAIARRGSARAAESTDSEAQPGSVH